jgi:iron complex transport system permease protein
MEDSRQPETSRALALGLCAVAAVAALSPFLGGDALDWRRALAGEWPDAEILWNIRATRTLLALVSGGALAAAGVLFQALLRDPLATPYTLGVSSGASLGAVTAIFFGWESVWGLPAVWTAALAGSGAALALVVAIASGGRRLSSFTLLLAGVTLNSVAMALILLLHSLAGFGKSFAIVHWLMGGLGPLSWPKLGAVAAVVAALALWIFSRSRAWNLLIAGEEWAASRGLDPGRLLLAGYIAGSVLTATITAITGPVGFVGLIVPHALRLKLGADHRALLPASLVYGAAFLGLCDIVSRVPVRPAEIPVGVITALIGGPVFILLLRSARRSLWL